MGRIILTDDGVVRFDSGAVIVVQPPIITPPPPPPPPPIITPISTRVPTGHNFGWKPGIRFQNVGFVEGTVHEAYYTVPPGWPGSSVAYGAIEINVSGGGLATYVDGVQISNPIYTRGNDVRVPVNPLAAPGLHNVRFVGQHTGLGSIDFNVYAM